MAAKRLLETIDLFSRHGVPMMRDDVDDFICDVSRRLTMIKSLGSRVCPDEVASAKLASGKVAEIVIASEDDAVRGALIVAYGARAAGGALDKLKVFSGTEVPRHMKPGRIDVCRRLPRTSRGKHDPKVPASARVTG